MGDPRQAAKEAEEVLGLLRKAEAGTLGRLREAERAAAREKFRAAIEATKEAQIGAHGTLAELRLLERAEFAEVPRGAGRATKVDPIIVKRRVVVTRAEEAVANARKAEALLEDLALRVEALGVTELSDLLRKAQARLEGAAQDLETLFPSVGDVQVGDVIRTTKSLTFFPYREEGLYVPLRRGSLITVTEVDPRLGTVRGTLHEALPGEFADPSDPMDLLTHPDRWIKTRDLFGGEFERVDVAVPRDPGEPEPMLFQALAEPTTPAELVRGTSEAAPVKLPKVGPEPVLIRQAKDIIRRRVQEVRETGGDAADAIGAGWREFEEKARQGGLKQETIDRIGMGLTPFLNTVAATGRPLAPPPPAAPPGHGLAPTGRPKTPPRAPVQPSPVKPPPQPAPTVQPFAPTQEGMIGAFPEADFPF